VTKPRCDYCQKPIEKKRHNQRFCSGTNCRQNWHHENTHKGEVIGLRAVKRGGYNLTIHYPELPPVQIGSKVSLETGSKKRQNASG